MSCTITSLEFEAFFDRGQWTYSETLPDVREKDIDEAIAEALAVMNQDLWEDETDCKQALYYLTAHFLVMDLQIADSGGQGLFMQTSRSADGISESLHIPEWMQNSDFALYTTTGYGIKYLMLAKPYLDGAIYSVKGGTRF